VKQAHLDQGSLPDCQMCKMRRNQDIYSKEQELHPAVSTRKVWKEGGKRHLEESKSVIEINKSDKRIAFFCNHIHLLRLPPAAGRRRQQTVEQDHNQKPACNTFEGKILQASFLQTTDKFGNIAPAIADGVKVVHQASEAMAARTTQSRPDHAAPQDCR
jgi:hypothetical protein